MSETQEVGFFIFAFMIGVLVSMLFAYAYMAPYSKYRDASEICAYAQGAGYEIPACEEEK